jgi:mannosyltransferase
VDAAGVEVIAPNLKRRYSGVTSTVLRLVPLQAKEIGIAAVGPSLPEDLPQVALGALPRLPRDRWRVWHARRNVEMLAGVVLRHVLGRRLRLMFTSAAQRRHSAWTRWLLRRMDRVVATSERAAGFLDVPAQVIRHGVDAALFAPPADKHALRRSLGLPEEAVVVGCFGRLRGAEGDGPVRGRAAGRPALAARRGGRRDGGRDARSGGVRPGGYGTGSRRRGWRSG